MQRLHATVAFLFILLPALGASPALAQNETESVSAERPGQSSTADSVSAERPEQNSGTDSVSADVPAHNSAGATQVPGELNIGLVPFFSDGQSLTEEAEQIFAKWLREVFESDKAGGEFAAMTFRWIDKKKTLRKLQEELPPSRGRQVIEALQPVAEAEKLDGVMAAWVVGGASQRELVMVLYLPDRIRLESYIAPVNFERSILTVTDGSFQKDTVTALMRELVRRNLNRVVLLQEAPAHSPASQPTSGSEGIPEDGDGPSPDPNPTPADGLEAGDGQASGTGSGSDGATTVAIFDFSKEFLEDESELIHRYSRLPLDFDLRRETTRLVTDKLGQGSVVRPMDSHAVTVNQAEAPALDLDPNADPKARERALLARARPEADAVIFGHLHQERKKKGPELRLIIRLLLRQTLATTVVEERWPPNPKLAEDTVRLRLGTKLDELFALAGIARSQSAADPEHLGPTSQRLRGIRPGETMTRVMRKCYGVENSTEQLKIARAVCSVNEIADCNDVKAYTALKLPEYISSWTLNQHKCFFQ